MEQQQKELQNRFNNIFIHQQVMPEVRVMRDGKPDLVMWRPTKDELQVAASGLDSSLGYCILMPPKSGKKAQEGPSYEIYHTSGQLLNTVYVSQFARPRYAPVVDWEAFDFFAGERLEQPSRLTEVSQHPGAPINLVSNYNFLLQTLLKVEDACEHMIGLSNLDNAGGDALYMDVSAAPPKAQDAFLDQWRDIQSGVVTDWPTYDQEAYLAALTYRTKDFCSWVAAAIPGKTAEEVQAKVSSLPPKKRNDVVSAAMRCIIPSLLHYTDEDKGASDTPCPDTPLSFPKSFIDALA